MRILANYWEGGVLNIMHCRSRQTIDPPIPTVPGRGTKGFHSPGKTSLAPSAKRRELFSESHQG